MSVRLFVGNLAYDTTEAELKTLFSACGEPLSVRIPTDRETGKPKGFAFIDFAERAQADEAVRRFSGELFKARPLVVNEARPREERTEFRPRPASGPGMDPGDSAAREAPARPSQPRGTFGPDAAPRGKRKPESRGPKGERAPKGPMRERLTGQFFSGDVDEALEDDPGADDFALWAQEKSESPDDE